MDVLVWLFGIAAGVIVFACALRFGPCKQIILDYQQGLVFRNGRLAGTRGAGSYWHFPWRTRIQVLDMRLRTVTLPGQEVLTADNITVKLSFAAQYRVEDVSAAVLKVESYETALYMALQLALREFMGGINADELTSKRGEIGSYVLAKAQPRAKEFGIDLQEGNVKDLVFPGDLKNIFALVVKARKEGQAILEKARAESAAIRNLANVAKVLEANPALLQLRALHSVESGSGNTIMLGVPAHYPPAKGTHVIPDPQTET
jgi:regulator of protease activity HflC (stomatin/prohibitin superfamily)